MNFKTKPMETIMDNNTTKLVVIQSYDNLMQAEIAKSILESAGIFCVLQDEYMAALYTPIAFPTRLMIREEDIEAAEVALGIR